MEYNKLVSVTGLSGLYELISSKADGGIVRSLEDNTTKFVSNRKHSFSQLEGIEIFTTKEDNVNLIDMFKAMKASKEKMPDAKADNKEVKAYFEKINPDMDFERVYSSDMKKMLKWLEIIDRNKIEIKSGKAKDDEAAGNEAATDKKVTTTNKTVNTKSSAVKAAPVKKINSPRKMA